LITVGSQAPDFTLPDEGGNQIQLSEQRGSWTVLWWFPKASTGGCTKEGQGFRDRSEQFAGAGTRILGASFDTPADNHTFADAQSFGFPLLCDVDRSVGSMYGVVRDPSEKSPDYPRRMTFLIDPSGRVAKIYEVRDTEAHAGEVLTDVLDLAKNQ
jgi:peroxiredoxin Q/BCP